MNAQDNVPVLKGHWRLDIYEGDEQTPETHLETIEGDNLVVTTGKHLYLDRLFDIGGSPAKVSAMGVGASATAAAVTDTQLNTTPTLLAFDSAPTRSALVVTCIRTFGTSEANIQWQELALFNGTVNGTSVMFNRISPIGPFTKTSAVSIVVTVTITAT